MLDFARFVHSICTHLFPDLVRDFASGSSLFLAAIRSAPLPSSSAPSASAFPLGTHVAPPVPSFSSASAPPLFPTASAPAAPPLSPHLSSHLLWGHLVRVLSLLNLFLIFPPWRLRLLLVYLFLLISRLLPFPLRLLPLLLLSGLPHLRRILFLLTLPSRVQRVYQGWVQVFHYLLGSPRIHPLLLRLALRNLRLVGRLLPPLRMIGMPSLPLRLPLIPSQIQMTAIRMATIHPLIHPLLLFPLTHFAPSIGA